MTTAAQIAGISDIHSWVFTRSGHKAGTTEYFERDTSEYAGTGRWEFIGDVANQAVRELYLNNPIVAKYKLMR